jgi:hypothetical protein
MLIQLFGGVRNAADVSEVHAVCFLTYISLFPAPIGSDGAPIPIPTQYFLKHKQKNVHNATI